MSVFDGHTKYRNNAFDSVAVMYMQERGANIFISKKPGCQNIEVETVINVRHLMLLSGPTVQCLTGGQDEAPCFWKKVSRIMKKMLIIEKSMLQ